MSENRVKPRISEDVYREKLGLKRLTEFGGEVLDSTPMQPPVGYVKQPSMMENLRALVATQLRAAAERDGFETEEEAEDFDDDDFDDFPLSGHEYSPEDEAMIRKAAPEMEKARQANLERMKKAPEKAPAPPARPAAKPAARKSADEALDNEPDEE